MSEVSSRSSARTSAAGGPVATSSNQAAGLSPSLQPSTSSCLSSSPQMSPQPPPQYSASETAPQSLMVPSPTVQGGHHLFATQGHQYVAPSQPPFQQNSSAQQYGVTPPSQNLLSPGDQEFVAVLQLLPTANPAVAQLVRTSLLNGTILPSQALQFLAGSSAAVSSEGLCD
ncbi:hypothetical protein PM082_020742 [Marasmius tenuissimus]|nr:hypothetical protein PM082_020742 [Marasmius tenuissimus]